MKIFTEDNNLIAGKIDVVKLAKCLTKLASRRKDSHGRSLGYNEKYFLRYKRFSGHSGNFLGGGTLHAPEFVETSQDVIWFTGGQLDDMAYDWTRSWDAVAKNHPPLSEIMKLQQTPKETPEEI